MSPTPLPRLFCTSGGDFRWHNVYRHPPEKLEQKVLGPILMISAEQLFLGKDLLAWLMLAIGGALVVANVAALVRPPRVDPRDPSSPRREAAPLSRVAPLVVLGLVVGGWALASLIGS